jgi:hypothetical protein
VLIKRRDKIGQVYLTRINPLVDFSFNTSDVLNFENAAVKSGVAKAPSSYTASWFTFDNNTGATSPLGETSSPTVHIPAPASLHATPGMFVLAEVRAIDSHIPPGQNTCEFSSAHADGWKLTGWNEWRRMNPECPPRNDGLCSARSRLSDQHNTREGPFGRKAANHESSELGGTGEH